MRICWKSNKMVKIQWTSLRASENIKVDSHRGIPYCVPPVWVLLVLYYPSSSRSLISNRARWFNDIWWQNWQLNDRQSDGQLYLQWSFLRSDTIPMYFGHMIPSQLLMRLCGLNHGWWCFLMLHFFTILGWLSQSCIVFSWCSWFLVGFLGLLRRFHFIN